MKISIIIPTLNEAAHLPAVVNAIKSQNVDAEVIVVDGGSRDGTRDIANEAQFIVVTSPKGRGQQLSAGAGLASGDILLFLHADTLLGPGALKAMIRQAAPKNVSGGNFRVEFDGGSDFAHWLNGFYARLRRNGFYYGDSAIFVKRDIYEAIGGIRAMALMEDYDFVRRLEKTGATICIDTPAVLTSARRFGGRRKWRIIWQWINLHILYYIGASHTFMAKVYRSEAHSPAKGREVL